jgi:hypothetical protein
VVYAGRGTRHEVVIDISAFGHLESGGYPDPRDELRLLGDLHSHREASIRATPSDADYACWRDRARPLKQRWVGVIVHPSRDLERLDLGISAAGTGLVDWGSAKLSAWVTDKRGNVRDATLTRQDERIAELLWERRHIENTLRLRKEAYGPHHR